MIDTLINIGFGIALLVVIVKAIKRRKLDKYWYRIWRVFTRPRLCHKCGRYDCKRKL